MSRSILRATLLSASFATLAALPIRAADAPAAPPPNASAIAPLPQIRQRPMVSMSLEEAIALALSKGFSAKLQEISLLNSKESWYRTRVDYMPQFTVGPSLNFGGSDSNVRTQSLGLTANVSQRIAPIGATVSLSTTPLSISRRSRTDPTYSNDLRLAISGISLLRLNPRYNLNSLRSARVGIDNAFTSYKAQLISIVQGVESAYLSVLQSRKSLENAQRSYQSAETTFNTSSARAQVGTFTQLQRDQAELTFLNQRNNFINSETSLIAAEDNLRTLLGGEQYNIGIIPTETISDYTGPLPTEEESFQRALANGTTYQTALKNLEVTENNVFVQRLNALPNITLSGDIGSAGSDSSYSPAAREAINRTDYSWNLRLSANISVPMRNEKSNARVAQNNLNSARISLEQTRNSILLQVRSNVRTIDSNSRQLTIAHQSLAIAERVFESEKARYDQGLSTYQAYLDADNALQSSRTSLLNSQVALRNAINSLRSVEGTTLDRFNIQLPVNDQ